MKFSKRKSALMTCSVAEFGDLYDIFWGGGRSVFDNVISQSRFNMLH